MPTQLSQKIGKHKNRNEVITLRAGRRRRRHSTRLGSNPRLPLDELNAENAVLKAAPSANVYHCAGKLWDLDISSALILQICIDIAIPTQGVMVMPNNMYVQLPRASTTAQKGFSGKRLCSNAPAFQSNHDLCAKKERRAQVSTTASKETRTEDEDLPSVNQHRMAI